MTFRDILINAGVGRLIKKRLSHLFAPYPNRRAIIAGATLHSTRSGHESGDDGPRTEGWDANPLNLNSFQDILMFEDGTTVFCTDWEREFATWTAGYADPKVGWSWAMGHHYIQVEVAQGTLNEPFKPAQLDALARLLALLAKEYNFPLVRLPYLTQKETPVPRGISAHDACANGRYYGKSDPGPLFPWDAVLASARAYADEGDDMADVTRAEFEEFKRITIERYADDHHWLEKLQIAVDALANRQTVQTNIDADWRQQHDALHRKGTVLP